RNLEYTQQVAGFSIVHATLHEPQRWGYVFDRLAAAPSFTCQNTAVCFFGHTHVPVAFIRESLGAVRGGTYSKLRIETGKKYFINAGSVGQPRDGNLKAAYVIYDMDAETIELRRVDCPPPGLPPGFGGNAPVSSRPGGPIPRRSAAEGDET